MNTLQLIMAQFAAIISLATASGILLHDSHIDKAFASTVNHAQADSGAGAAHADPGHGPLRGAVAA